MQTTEIRTKVLVPRNRGLTTLDVLGLPKETRAKVLTNKQHDHVLFETDIWKSYKEVYFAWTRELGVYAQPGRRLCSIFGSAVKYTDPRTNQVWIFEVPAGPLRKAKDSILLANADDCEVEVKKNRITIYVPERKVSVVENFPAKDGWYQTDPTFGVPVNVPLCDSDSNARRFYRIDKRVGPIARGYDDYCCGRLVIAYYSPSLNLGVLTLDEASEQIKAETGQN